MDCSSSDSKNDVERQRDNGSMKVTARIFHSLSGKSQERTHRILQNYKGAGGRLSYSLPFREGQGVGFLREGLGVGFLREGLGVGFLIDAGGYRGEARALSSSCVG